MNSVLVASMEAIDFQRGSTFLKDLALQFASARQNPSTENLLAVEKAINGIAKRHTGMTFRFHFAKMRSINAYVIISASDSANPMRPAQTISRFKAFNEMPTEQQLFKGSVDLKTAKVSGIYSEIPVDVFFATEFLTDASARETTPEQHAAIAMHEFGHAFYYLRFLGKMTISNLVVAEVVKKQHEGESPKVIQEILRVTEKKYGYRFKDVGSIDGSTDPIIIQQIVMAQVVDSIRSELGTRFYDRRAFEFAADQFVARHGGASEIVKGLDAISKHYPKYHTEYRRSMENLTASLISYIKPLLIGMGYTLISTMASAAAAFGTGGIALILLAGTYMVGRQFVTNLDEGIYDPLEHRFLAMRRELVASSKAESLNATQRKEIQRQIDEIDEITSGFSKLPYFGRDIVYPWLNVILTGKAGEQKFQRQLENLVNNRLFELSNKLQTSTV